MAPYDKSVNVANTFQIVPGKHTSPEGGLCAMEVEALLNGGPHTDSPRCTCELIDAFVRHINDHMPDDVRQRLMPFLPRLIGTVLEPQVQARNEFFAWQTVRVFAPAALRAQGYRRFAQVLQNAETLFRAQRTADVVQQGVMKREPETGPTPAQLAAHLASRAAGAALWFADHQNDPLRGASSITPYTLCADAAAGAAFQAYRAGATDIWEKVLDALDKVLLIGSEAAAKRQVSTVA